MLIHRNDDAIPSAFWHGRQETTIQSSSGWNRIAIHFTSHHNFFSYSPCSSCLLAHSLSLLLLTCLRKKLWVQNEASPLGNWASYVYICFLNLNSWPRAGLELRVRRYRCAVHMDL